jgi:spermidine synthase
MKKWVSVDKALTADGNTISLHEHDGDYTIRLDGATLMSTRQHASEEKLAELACAHLKGKRGARVLIGGLGFGFTMKAALAAVAVDATVVIAEIVAAVIAWNRNPAFKFAANGMEDPRVIVRHQDVREAIGEARGGFDSIILDVDNGPAALSADGNHRLYDRAGLQAARTALRPEGSMAIWSVARNPAFERLWSSAGFAVEVRSCPAHGNSGGRHTLYLGRMK